MKSLILFFASWIIIACWPLSLGAATNDAAGEAGILEEFLLSPRDLIAQQVLEDYDFFGLATYYNNLNYYLVDNAGIRRIVKNQPTSLGQNQWLAIVGRLEVLLIRAPGLELIVDVNGPEFSNTESLNQPEAILKIASKNDLFRIAPELEAWS